MGYIYFNRLDMLSSLNINCDWVLFFMCSPKRKKRMLFLWRHIWLFLLELSFLESEKWKRGLFFHEARWTSPFPNINSLHHTHSTITIMSLPVKRELNVFLFWRNSAGHLVLQDWLRYVDKENSTETLDRYALQSPYT